MNNQSDIVARTGLYASLFVAFLAIVSFGIAIFTPPLSGPFCLESCFSYPFLDTASRFPRDFYWMYPAILLYVVFMVWIAGLHRYAPENKKIYSQIGLSFGIISAAILIVDYFLQLSVIQPSLINGEVDGIALLSQYNPHGIFIALEEIGYLLMSVSFLFLAPAFSDGKLELAVRWVFIASFTLSMLALAFIVFQFGLSREYRFEVAAISINWLTLIISGGVLGLVFKKKVKEYAYPS